MGRIKNNAKTQKVLDSMQVNLAQVLILLQRNESLAKLIDYPAYKQVEVTKYTVKALKEAHATIKGIATKGFIE